MLLPCHKRSLWCTTLVHLAHSGCPGDQPTSPCTCLTAALSPTPSTSRSHLAPRGDHWYAGYHIPSTTSPTSETTRTTASGFRPRTNSVSADPRCLSKCWASKVCLHSFIILMYHILICNCLGFSWIIMVCIKGITCIVTSYNCKVGSSLWTSPRSQTLMTLVALSA